LGFEIWLVCGIFAPADLLGLSWPCKSRRVGQEILVAKFLGEVAERLKATVLKTSAFLL
jgi:hypothetical protein